MIPDIGADDTPRADLSSRFARCKRYSRLDGLMPAGSTELIERFVARYPTRRSGQATSTSPVSIPSEFASGEVTRNARCRTRTQPPPR